MWKRSHSTCAYSGKRGQMTFSPLRKSNLTPFWFREVLSPLRQSLPAAEALPDFGGAAFTQHLVLGELRCGGARVVGQHAQARADGEAREVDRAAIATRDDAVLLVRVGDDHRLHRAARRVAHEPVALVDLLPRGAAVARERHPAGVGDDPVLLAL